MSKEARNYKPTKGYLLLDPIDNEQSSQFKIEDQEETPQRAVVLVVGGSTWHTSGQKFEAPARVGDTVIHSGFGFESIRIEGSQYRLCPFDKILAVYKK